MMDTLLAIAVVYVVLGICQVPISQPYRGRGIWRVLATVVLYPLILLSPSDSRLSQWYLGVGQ